MTERGYDEIFESWEPLLKDPNQVKNFKIVQDLLERKKGKINLGFLGRVFYHGALFVMVKTDPTTTK